METLSGFLCDCRLARYPICDRKMLCCKMATSSLSRRKIYNSFTQSNLSGQIIPRGIGEPSPSLLTVLRRTPSGGQVSIRVNLNRALQDPHENIMVQPDDVLILQETPS